LLTSPVFGIKKDIQQFTFALVLKMENITVQLYEDNAGLRNMLSLLIENTAGYKLCGAFENAADAVKNFSEQKPDVILLDIEMPVVNGLEGVKLIRSVDKNVFIIMWTVFDSDGYLFEALKLGANGYMLKGTPPSQILESVKEVFNGGAPMSPSIAKRVLQYFSQKPATDSEALSPREKEILSELVNGKSYKMIASALGISFETVKTHLKKIYDKLHVHSQSEAVAKALKERLI
jgi:DNA-binding NarL/FixJ family response regulator